MSSGLPRIALFRLKLERATTIYVAVCDPEDSQGPFWVVLVFSSFVRFRHGNYVLLLFKRHR